MRLLIDENVPASVADVFRIRGHHVEFVRDVLPCGTQDPIVARIGDRLSAIVVTWDRDFDQLVRRVPEGNKAAFRRLGRITFSCSEVEGARLLESWIDHIELHYTKAQTNPDVRMIVQIQGQAIKFW
jgi:predicted nuclease of predicted toxin-antitoxin system